MGILGSIKEKVVGAADVVREKYDVVAEKYRSLEEKEREMWERHEARAEARRRDRELRQDQREIAANERRARREIDIENRKSAGINPKRAQRLLEESEKQYESDITPTSQKVLRVGKRVAGVAGGVIVSGTRYITTDGHGRSGKRATKEWRRENRAYQSEARKTRVGVASPGVFSSVSMFGENRIPTRSRYRGANEIGTTTDPLSNFSSGILGSAQVRQDRTIEGSVRKGMREEREMARLPSDSLASFSHMVTGGKTEEGKGKKKYGRQSGGLDSFNRMLKGI